MYAEFATDPVVQALSFDDQRHFVMLLCLKGSGVLDKKFGHAQVRIDVIRNALGLDGVAFQEAKHRLCSACLIDGDWQPINWDKRQFKSDKNDPTAADRMRRYRNEHRNEHRNDTVTLRLSETDTDTDNRLQKKKDTSAAARPTHEDFEHIRSVYPRRAGTQPWSRALKAALARRKEGHPWEELSAGTARYAEFCRITSKVGTEYVMQASRFFGPDKYFLQPWDPPATKADARLSANISAAEEFMRRTGKKQ